MSSDRLMDAPSTEIDVSPGRLLGGFRGRGLLDQALLTGGAVVVLFLVWEGLSRLELRFWPPIVLSRPTEIIPAFFEAVTTGFVWRHFWVTFQETILGFVFGAGGGFLLGVGVSLSPTFRKAFYPLIVLFQSTPRVALAPIFGAWLGFGMDAKVALSATICFFPVLVNTITGLTMIEENAGLLMKSLRARRWQTFWFLRLPSSIPTVFAGLKAALTFALIGAIVGEFFRTTEGAGHLIETAAFQFRMEDVFAYLIMLALFGLGLFLLAGWTEKKLLFWHVDADQPA